jgi:hypothetical protein
MTSAVNRSYVPINELVNLFVQISLAQDKALLYEDYSTFNRLFDEIHDIMRELRSRSGDQRRALMSLYDHPNAQVRLSAAVATLELEPAAARRVLEIIDDRHEFPQAADARGLLEALDQGRHPNI